MNISDLIVIYLAFGAPFAVYKYLQSRTTSRGRKLVFSVATLIFWIPAAAKIAYRHLTNAYYKPAFVSQEILDSRDFRLDELRESLRTGFTSNGMGLGMHDLREVIDRYTGLSQLVADEGEHSINGYASLFEAAGRTDSRTGSACLIRRNRLRVRRHHTQAREHFVSLFEQICGPDERVVLNDGIELARHLGDRETASKIEQLLELRSTLWNPEQKQELAPANYSTAASSLHVRATALKVD
jgi:hypothetical protein